MSHLRQPATELLHEANVTQTWSVQIWNNGMIKIYNDPRRQLSSAFAATLGKDATLQIFYKHGAKHSRQIPAFVRKYAIRTHQHYFTSPSS